MAEHQHEQSDEYDAINIYANSIPVSGDYSNDLFPFTDSTYEDNTWSLLAGQGCHIPDSFESINDINPTLLHDLLAPVASELFSQHSNDSQTQPAWETTTSTEPLVQEPDPIHPIPHNSATSSSIGRLNERRLPTLLPRSSPSISLQYRPNLPIDTIPNKVDSGREFGPNFIINDGKVGAPRSGKADMRKLNKKTGILKAKAAPPRNVPRSYFAVFPSKQDALLQSSKSRNRRGQGCFNCAISKKSCSGVPPFDVPCDACIQCSQSGNIHWKACFESDLCDLNIILEGLRMNKGNKDFKPIVPKNVKMENIRTAMIRRPYPLFPASIIAFRASKEPSIYEFWDAFFDSVHEYDFYLHELFALPIESFSESHFRIHAYIVMLLYAQHTKCSDEVHSFTRPRLIAGVSERLFKEVKCCISHLRSSAEREDKKSLLMVLNYMALLIARQQSVASATPKHHAMVDHLKLYLGHWVTKLRGTVPDIVLKSLQDHRRQLKAIIVFNKVAIVGELNEASYEPLRKHRQLQKQLVSHKKDVEKAISKTDELILELKARSGSVHPNLIETTMDLKKKLSTTRTRLEKADSAASEAPKLPQLGTDKAVKAIQELNHELARFYDFVLEMVFGKLWTGVQSSSV